MSAYGIQNTLSLSAVLLQAANNDPQAAAQLRSELVESMNYGGAVKPAPPGSPGPIGGPGPIHQPEAAPLDFGGGGLCTPAPPLVNCPGEIPTWGTYTFSWKPFGADPFGGDPFGPPLRPDTDGCVPDTPDYVGCKIFNDDRQQACGRIGPEMALVGSAEYGALSVCLGGGIETLGATCAVGFVTFGGLLTVGLLDQHTCDTPYTNPSR